MLQAASLTELFRWLHQCQALVRYNRIFHYNGSQVTWGSLVYPRARGYQFVPWLSMVYGPGTSWYWLLFPSIVKDHKQNSREWPAIISNQIICWLKIRHYQLWQECQECQSFHWLTPCSLSPKFCILLVMVRLPCHCGSWWACLASLVGADVSARGNADPWLLYVASAVLLVAAAYRTVDQRWTAALREMFCLNLSSNCSSWTVSSLCWWSG